MSGTWYPRDGYEVLFLASNSWAVIVHGGTHSRSEPAWWTVATCLDRDEAFRVRDALRATIEGPSE